MQALLEKTVAEIVAESPSSIRVFETFGIDYCCGGKRNLKDACTRLNVDATRLLSLLTEAAADLSAPVPGEWNEKRLSDLVAYIVETHHAYIRRESPRIELMLEKVVMRHGHTYAQLSEIKKLFDAMVQELANHLMKEEQILFPWIARMEAAVSINERALPPACFASVKRPIANMMAEHDDAGALLSQIRNLSNGFRAPEGACATFQALYLALEEFERDLHRHVHLENNILFPRAIEMEEMHLARA